MAEKKKKKDNKNKGFTLIELLAVVAIIALLAGVVVFAVTRIFGSSEEKANEVSYEAIKKSAVTYASENYMSANYWVKDGEEDTEYSCVPVLELTNKGYLKKEDIQDLVGGWNFIRVNRYASNKTIYSEENGDDVCFWGTDGDKSTILSLGSITTTTVNLQAYCTNTDEDNSSVSGISFAQASKEYSNEIVEANDQNKYVYKFSDLDSGKAYRFKARCNYNNGVSAREAVTGEIVTGTMEYDFKLPYGNVVQLNEENGNLYKTIEVEFNSNGVTAPSYYFKTSSSGTFVDQEVMVCGNDVEPDLTKCQDVDNDSGEIELEKKYWYKLKIDADESNGSVKLDVYNNSTISVVGHDGEKPLKGKSTQITFSSNPYVVWKIEPNIANVSSNNGSAIGTSEADIDFHVGTWIDFPKISWTIYGGYDTISTVYYDSNNSYSSRGSANKVGYTCEDDTCEITDLTDVQGKQKFRIVVINEETKAETEIIINMDIDKIKPGAPSITNPTNGNWTNANFKLTLTGSDDEAGVGYYQYTYSDSASSTGDDSASQWVTYENSASNSFTTTAFSKERNQDVYIRVCDKAGNCSDKSSTSIKIDKTGPSTPTITNPSGGNWTNQNVVLTIKSSDPTSNSVSSGIKQMYYSYDQSNWYYDWDSGYDDATSGTVRGTWSAERNNTVYVKVVDNAGNESTYATTAIKIDKTNPTAPTTMEYVFGDWSRYTRGNWTNKPVYAANTSSSKGPSGSTDTNGSGLAKYQISSNGSTWVDYSYDYTSSMYCFSTTGTHIRYFRAVDNAGNVSTSISRTALIDVASPTLTIINPSNGNWSTANITVTLNFSDSGGSLINPSSLQWKDNLNNTTYSNLSNTSTTSKTDTWSGEGNRVGTYKICDVAGNCVEKSTSIKIDKTAPTVPTLTNSSGGNWTNSNITVTASSTDSVSGVDHYEWKYGSQTYSSDPTTWQTFGGGAFSAERNQAAYFRACDVAGNCSGSSNTPIKIDKTKPVIKMSIKNASGTTINADANYQGTQTIKYNDGDWSKSVPTISFTITDASSITNYVYYNSAGVYTGSPTSATSLHTFNSSDRTAKTGSISINSDGIRQLKFVVTDQAGNVSTISVNAWLDFVKPSDPASVTFSSGTLTFGGGTDSQSGVDGYSYSFYLNSPWTYKTGGAANSVSISSYGVGSYTVYVLTRDKAGNESGSPGFGVTISNKYSYNYCASGYSYSNGYCYYTTNASSYCSSYCTYSGGQYCNYDTYWGKSFCYSTYDRCVNGCGSDCACMSYSNYCSSGSLSGSYCYHYGTVYTSYYCPSGTTEYNGLCYSVS